MRVANLWKSGPGDIRVREGATITCGEGQVDATVNISTSASCAAAGNLFANATIRLTEGGRLTAKGVFLTDRAGASGSLSVNDPGSTAELAGALAVGQAGEGFLFVENKGRVACQTGGIAIFAGSRGDASVTDAEWTINPGNGGGGLLVGAAGIGTLNVTAAGNVRVTGAADVILGREAGSEGTLRIKDLFSTVDATSRTLVVGQSGKGTLEVGSGANLKVRNLHVGQSMSDNRASVGSTDAVLTVLDELVVGSAGVEH